MGRKLFRKEAIEHHQEANWGDVVISYSSSYGRLVHLILIITALSLVFLSLGTYERRASVKGYLAPTTGLVKVYPRSKGIVSKKYVSEGQLVEKGEKLVTVSTVRTSENVDDIDAVLITELKKTEALLLEKIGAENDFGRIELERLTSTIDGLENEVKQLQEHLNITRQKSSASLKRVEEYRSLIRKGSISESQYQDQVDTHLNNEIDTQSVESELIEKENLLTNAKHQLEQLPFRQLSKQTDLRKAISEIKQKYLNIEGVRNYTIFAPSSGRLTAFQADLGRNILPENMIGAILQDNSEFEADLFVPTHSIGFIKLEQTVKIRYKAFPFQRFGTYEGIVSNITNIILSPDEVMAPIKVSEPVYRVTVKLNSQSVTAYGNDLKLQAGMVLDADIVLDQLSLMDWLLDPLYRISGRM